jgi:heparinase II/III-like protein
VISPLLERFGKLKGRSIDELRVRCAQTARARLERIGWSHEVREPSDRELGRLLDWSRIDGSAPIGDRLLQHFRERNPPLAARVPGLANPSATAKAFLGRCQTGAIATIASADRILAGKLDLGTRVVSIDPDPDWTFEPVSGTRAPSIHWSRIAFLDPTVAGDCKFTWELNRHQYFLTLARAFLITGDARYARLVVAHLDSWMHDNPPKIGINWTSSLELALRAISWIWALHLIRDSGALDGRLFTRALKYFYLQARHIECNLSTYFSPNTHLTGEALGLLYIGTAFPEFKRAPRWRSLGHRILLEQLDRQLFADGVYFEQSSYYHRYTTDFYLHALLLTDSGHGTSDGKIRSSLGALLDYLVHITRPDGSSPLIGDEDGGRLVVLGNRATNDFRDTLALGATLLQRADYAYVAGDATDELVWLLGPDALGAYEALEASPPAVHSRAFAESGYFVMRECWDRDADWALIRCGPHAPLTGAHAHADALALELSIGGSPMFVDPGTYVYTASRSSRDQFRCGAAHNTLTIDAQSSATPGASAFRWETVPRSRADAWVATDAFDYFDGEHDGFLRLDCPALHSRAVFFLKGEYWVIHDRVRSAGRHDIALHLHWAPGVTVTTDAPDTLRAAAANRNGPPVDARIFARTGELSSEQGWVSTAFGTRSSAPLSVFRLDGEQTEDIVTVLARSTAGIRLADCAWRASADSRGGILTIAMESASDTILIGDTGYEHARDGIDSDARWAWVRRSIDGELLGFALVHATKLIVDERFEFQNDSAVKWAIGRRVGGDWHVEATPLTGPPTPSNPYRAPVDEPCAASAE